MRHRFVTVDVFTDRPFGGNPLVVFPHVEDLTAAQMQRVAREFGALETVFVFPPQDPAHDRSLRLFTSQTELPFAGHPTLGAAHVLVATGEVPAPDGDARLVLGEAAGPVEVRLRVSGGVPVFAQLQVAGAPEFGPPAPPASALADMLSLDDADLLPGAQAVSCGLPVLLVPLASRDALKRALLRRDLWQAAVAPAWAPHVYVYTHDPKGTWPEIRARMFAPAMHVAEDPATGAAATALAAALAAGDPRPDATLRWAVGQGVEIGRPSILDVEADKAGGQVTAVRVGGASVLVAEGTMTIPGDGGR